VISVLRCCFVCVVRCCVAIVGVGVVERGLCCGCVCLTGCVFELFLFLCV